MLREGTNCNAEKCHAAICLHPILAGPSGKADRAHHSGLAGALPAAPALTQSLDLNLSGFALGSDTNAGSMHRLKASDAMISPLGTVTLTGFLVIPIKGGAQRPVHGKVTLANAEGKVTVSLKGTVTAFTGPVSLLLRKLDLQDCQWHQGRSRRKGNRPGAVRTGAGRLLPHRFLLDFGNAIPPP